MEKNREGYKVSDTHRECTKCSSVFEKTSKTMTLCKPCNSARVKSQTTEYKMYRRALERCKKSGREFTITPHDIYIPDRCPILGIPLKENSGKSGCYPNSPSLDRIDNTKGYTPDNVQVISTRANQMKGSSSVDDLRHFADWVYKTYPTEK